MGIKGTGMISLLTLFQERGLLVGGSDSLERFYTDHILDSAGIQAQNIESKPSYLPDFAVYSGAYSFEHPQLAYFRQWGIPLFSYSEVLGFFSRTAYSLGVCGVHGKTTTTALLGVLLKDTSLSYTVVAGSYVHDFTGSTYTQEDSVSQKVFIAETCEYKRNFLYFHPDIVIFNALEHDHPDYFSTYQDIKKAFLDYLLNMKKNGLCLYNADDTNVLTVIKEAQKHRLDLFFVGFGFSALSFFSLKNLKPQGGQQTFFVPFLRQYITLNAMGVYNAQNALGALAGACALLFREHCLKKNVELVWNNWSKDTLLESEITQMISNLSRFKGIKRRFEFKGETKQRWFFDDYAHHPTAISLVLQAFKAHYPSKRLVVHFIPHTFSRTYALWEEFISSFQWADVLILHPIYGSPRERGEPKLSKQFFKAIKGKYARAYYHSKLSESLSWAKKNLQEDDLFLTLGAGNNAFLGEELYQYFREQGSI